MMNTTSRWIGITLAGLMGALSGCAHEAGNQSQDQAAATALWQHQSLAGEWAMPLDKAASRWLTVGERTGIQLMTRDGTPLDHWDLRSEYLDTRSGNGAEGDLFVSLDTEAAQPRFFELRDQRIQPLVQTAVPTLDYPVDGLCLYRDSKDALYLFVLSELHQAHQYLVSRDGDAVSLAPVRSLPVAPGSEYCAVDDRSDTLYVSESGVAVWAYGAHPEAPVEREPVALAMPFGRLVEGGGAIAMAPGELLMVSGAELQSYPLAAASQTPDTLRLSADSAVETLTARQFGERLWVTLFDEATAQFHFRQWPAAEVAVAAGADRLPVVAAQAETLPVPQDGDAADDPAIWVNAANVSDSRILGTNKRSGLHVYDLTGSERQVLPVGRVNNVDVRYGQQWQGRNVDVAVASNRSSNSLSLFAIEPHTGEVSHVTDVATDLPEIYGLCLYQAKAGDLYAFANDKSGRYVQYRLDLGSEAWGGLPVREFALDSQPEGCVADDTRGRLFVGEEDRGIWALGADPGDGQERVLLDEIGPRLHDDVEGLSLFGGEFLVASSQGNNSYVVYYAEPPFKPVGAFRVGMNRERMIDGVSETDGLAVTAQDLGGPWREGLLVVQDGRNVLPAQRQNFKLVPWRGIRETLGLPTSQRPSIAEQ